MVLQFRATDSESLFNPQVRLVGDDLTGLEEREEVYPIKFSFPQSSDVLDMLSIILIIVASFLFLLLILCGLKFYKMKQ